MSDPTTIRLATALLLLVLPVTAAADSSSSPSYVMTQATLNGGGGLSTASTTYRMEDSMGQESVVGCSAGPHYVLQSGFWSHVGSGLVPVLLTVTKNLGNPALPDLSWTGNDPPYGVYRSTDPATIYQSLDHTQIPRSWTDPSPPPGTVIYYSILPTAPGPLRGGEVKRFAPARAKGRAALSAGGNDASP